MNNNSKAARLFFALFLVLIFAFAVFLRVYKFHDWLHFKWDQARDALLVAQAIDGGPENLPLQGPRATKVGDGFLRLGPAFYYFQYLSGIIFSSTDPEVFAYPDLLFSILTIPLLYVFARNYFSKTNSLLVTILYSFSFLVIQYSRSAWNPNAVPFFTLLTFWSLIKFSNEKTFKKKLAWLALCSLGYSIASQLHYFAFFALSLIIALFLIYKYQLYKIFYHPFALKKYFTKQTLGMTSLALAIIIFLNTPLIVSDLKTNGSNTKNFFLALTQKPKKDKTLWQKVVRNLREQPKNYFLLVTSFDHRSGMKADPIPVGFGTALILSGIVLAAIFLRDASKENDSQKKDFLTLTIIWTLVFFVYTIPLSYQLRPRYFTVVFPLGFIFLGYWMVLFEKIYAQRARIVVSALVFSVVVLNLYGSYQWFVEQKMSQLDGFKTFRSYILKRQDGITLAQLEKAVEYIANNSEVEVVFYSDMEYKAPIIYLLQIEEKPFDVKYINETADLAGVKNFWAFNNTAGTFGSLSKKVRDFAIPLETVEFGQLTIYKMEPHQKSLANISQAATLEKDDIQNQPETEDVENEDEIFTNDTERLFWKDLFK